MKLKETRILDAEGARYACIANRVKYYLIFRWYGYKCC